MKTVLTALGIALTTGMILSGCGDDKSDSKEAQFKVQLNNTADTSSSLSMGTSLMAVATSLTVKLGGVDLLADCTGDQPPGTCLDIGRSPDPDIWVNAGCNNDLAQCTTANTEFFELISPTAANAVLNSQGRSIEPGTFTKVRIYILNNDSGEALQCNGVASAVRPAAPLTITLPAPMVVAAGESVTVTLNYDPSLVDCANDVTISTAISGITATVTKN